MATAQRRRAGAHWTLPALLLVFFFWTALWGVAASYPAHPGTRTNATVLERKWETLFSRSYLGISGGRSELNWESDYLQGIKRVRRLYCNVGIGFHLQVLPDGKISGVHSESPFSECASGHTHTHTHTHTDRERESNYMCKKKRKKVRDAHFFLA